MPSALTRACPSMGCENKAPCPLHAPAPVKGQRRSRVTQKAYDHRRGSAHSRGYTVRWNRARLVYLDKHPLCAECERQNTLTAATLVDHIIPHKGDQSLFWDESNWQPLCKSCHDQKTWREVKSGLHAPPRVVVCGPPGAGKSTYVQAQAQPWDIVWDFDAVASAVAYQGKEIPRELRGPGMPYAALEAVMAMRAALLDWLAKTPLTVAVYVIVTKRDSADTIASRINATVVAIDAHQRTEGPPPVATPMWAIE